MRAYIDALEQAGYLYTDLKQKRASLSGQSHSLHSDKFIHSETGTLLSPKHWFMDMLRKGL